MLTPSKRKETKTKRNYQCLIMSRRWLITSKTERDVSLPFPKTKDCNLALVLKSTRTEGVKDPCQALPKNAFTQLECQCWEELVKVINCC